MEHQNGVAVSPACVRKAWLELGAQTIQLEDRKAGYLLSSLDLGYGAPRVVDNNRPDQDGIDDRTQFQGSRVVSADLIALTDLGARVDEVAMSFAPFMHPRQRPVLHYVLDAGSNPERTLTLRPDGYAWKVEDPGERDIHLQWVAADPVSRSPVTSSATAWAGTGVLAGRTYTDPYYVAHDRQYAAGGGMPTIAVIVVHGDVPITPHLMIYGPITDPLVTFDTVTFPSQHFEIGMAGYRIDAGHFVSIDTDQHTAYLDDNKTQSVLAELNWQNLVWPVLPVAPDETYMALSGTVTSGLTQVIATWQDGYLT